jgi:hypothetical protein
MFEHRIHAPKTAAAEPGRLGPGRGLRWAGDNRGSGGNQVGELHRFVPSTLI